MRPITGITILGYRLGVIALSVYWITLFVGTHWPAGSGAGPGLNDKLLHFTAFFGLALLGCYVTQSPPGDLRAATIRFFAVFLLTMTYAAIDEATQVFARGRHPDVMDFAADVSGALVGITLYVSAKWLWGKLLGRPRPELKGDQG